MELEQLRRYLLAKPGAREDFPFGPEHLVLKVGERMFALIALTEDPLRINLKCDPGQAQALRDAFAAVLPGYHMNKRHWNTVVLDGSIPPEVLRGMLDASYALVAAALPAAQRQRLALRGAGR